jgi:hypothetical protein
MVLQQVCFHKKANTHRLMEAGQSQAAKVHIDIDEGDGTANKK